MPDYRTFFDSQCLFAFHLQGRSHVLRVAKVTGGELTGTGGKKSRKPMVYFAGKEKPMALNKTNGKVIAAMYGADTKGWIGKDIEIFPTTTTFGAETVDCIRVKPGIPSAAKSKASGASFDENAPPPIPDDERGDPEPPEPGSDG